MSTPSLCLSIAALCNPRSKTTMANDSRLAAVERAILWDEVNPPATRFVLQVLKTKVRETYEFNFESVLRLLGFDEPSNVDGKVDAALQVIEKVALVVHAHNAPGLSINSIVDNLSNSTPGDPEYQSLQIVVFACLGYLTFVYFPRHEALYTERNDELSFDLPAFSRMATHRFDVAENTRDIFGQYLPIGPHQSSGATLYASRVAYHSLYRLSNIRIIWVDVLAAHLDFDPSTRRLMVFRFPSFCHLHLVYSLRSVLQQ